MVSVHVYLSVPDPVPGPVNMPVESEVVNITLPVGIGPDPKTVLPTVVKQSVPTPTAAEEQSTTITLLVVPEAEDIVVVIEDDEVDVVDVEVVEVEVVVVPEDITFASKKP